MVTHLFSMVKGQLHAHDGLICDTTASQFIFTNRHPHPRPINELFKGPQYLASAALFFPNFAFFIRFENTLNNCPATKCSKIGGYNNALSLTAEFLTAKGSNQQISTGPVASPLPSNWYKSEFVGGAVNIRGAESNQASSARRSVQPLNRSSRPANPFGEAAILHGPDHASP